MALKNLLGSSRDHALSGFDRYRLRGRVNKIIRAVPMMVTESPRESVIKPKTIGDTAPEPNVTA